MDRSVKARVIALAKRDPFLKVEELAAEAQTTASYVRTILSEAQLSLNEMRREYARRLERNVDTKQMEMGLEIQKELRITRINGAMVQPAIPIWEGEELYQASAPEKLGPLTCYVRLITPCPLKIMEKYSSLRDLLTSPSDQQLEVKEQRVEIIPAPEELARILNLPKFSQLLQLTTTLYQGKLPLAVETKWFGAEGLVLEWSKLESELKVGRGV
ncbi:MAG: hypothetical protein GX971_15060 [Firmicutes bacterium]|nr:hypothetical protein [Bacillota bacterium]